MNALQCVLSISPEPGQNDFNLVLGYSAFAIFAELDSKYFSNLNNADKLKVKFLENERELPILRKVGGQSRLLFGAVKIPGQPEFRLNIG